MHSMTGYGRGEGICGEEHLWVEMRSLNHRYLECAIRLPQGYNYLEEEARKLITGHLKRGRVEVNINVAPEGRKAQAIRIDNALALTYYNALKELSNLLSIKFEPNIDTFTAYPGIFLLEDREPDRENAGRALDIALRAALGELLQMRRAEGNTLKRDITHRINRIEQVIKDIKNRAPQVVEDYRKKLKERLSCLLAEGALEEERLFTEVVYFAERANIAEELVRMSSHINLFRAALAESGAIGRKLEFILQEMHREVNTIGSKSGDALLARSVVELKSELEKIREQLQNVE
ncbi:MAG: YicC family protein [Firmicutes bacterium]|nr:YicC family protein [Bacillota bacterium]